MDRFDPLFFNISPREAVVMDPQERLFLQCVYETMEDAGYTRQDLAGRARDTGPSGSVGVFVGVMYEEYQLYGAQMEPGVALGGSPSSIANRVSYFCNFHGPSLAMDTMCSSSLTAIHLACDSLRNGSCELAVAGGVNVTVHPNKYLTLSQGQFAASNGRCMSFGTGGDGYVPGEGVGAVLLKPLARAVADGDRIYGVIKGTAINHGGKTNGYTVPNPQAQGELIEDALRKAGVHPRTISYVEAHGRHGAWRPDRGCGFEQGVRSSDAGQAVLCDRLGEVEHRALRECGGDRGADEGAAATQARPAGAEPAQRGAEPEHRLRAHTLRGAAHAGRVEASAGQSCGEPQREYPRIAGISSFGAGDRTRT
ncbi:polyketide synthase [Variovorax sp. NFACC26]